MQESTQTGTEAQKYARKQAHTEIRKKQKHNESMQETYVRK